MLTRNTLAKCCAISGRRTLPAGRSPAQLAHQFRNEVNPLCNGRSIGMGHGGQPDLVAPLLQHGFEPREPRLRGITLITVDDEGAFPHITWQQPDEAGG